MRYRTVRPPIVIGSGVDASVVIANTPKRKGVISGGAGATNLRCLATRLGADGWLDSANILSAAERARMCGRPPKKLIECAIADCGREYRFRGRSTELTLESSTADFRQRG